MIEMVSPHMVIYAQKSSGDKDYPEPKNGYNMLFRHSVAEGVSLQTIVHTIISLAKSTKEGVIKSLVINSHGLPGQIFIGEGIRTGNVSALNPLKGFVGMIWVLSCQVGSDQFFCSEFAKASGTFVFAATGDQFVDSESEIPYGYIDDFEGSFYMWAPGGYRIFGFKSVGFVT